MVDEVVASVEANPKGPFLGAGLGQLNGGKSSSGAGLKSTRLARPSCNIRRPICRQELDPESSDSFGDSRGEWMGCEGIRSCEKSVTY